MLKVKEDELIFTSCGSESNNLAIEELCFNIKIVVNILLQQRLNILRFMKHIDESERTFGFEVTYLNVDQKGRISFTRITR